MITDRLQLEPLGGIYRGQFWPVAASTIPVLEAYLGEPLPESYVSFVTAYGTSRPAVEMLIDGPDGQPIGLDNFYGDPESEVASVVKLAEQYPDLGHLTIARASNGLFFMAPGGTILFERSGVNERIAVASSFDDFITRLQPDPMMA